MIEAAIALFLVYGSYEGSLSIPFARSESIETQIQTPTLAEEILAAAKACVAKRTPYRMSYPEIPYPGGDVSPTEGLCCDVVIRSLRAAGIDLQELVYEDSHAAREEYLKVTLKTGFQRPLNRSWIHRRTASLNLYLSRNTYSLPPVYNAETAETWKPGDIVIYLRNGWETWHAAIVSDATDPASGAPLVIDGWSTPGYVTDTHTLTSYGPIGGHFRIPEDFRSNLPVEHLVRAKSAWNVFIGETEETTVVAETGNNAAEYETGPSFNGFGLPFLFGTR